MQSEAEKGVNTASINGSSTGDEIYNTSYVKFHKAESRTELSLRWSSCNSSRRKNYGYNFTSVLTFTFDVSRLKLKSSAKHMCQRNVFVHEVQGCGH